MGIADRDYMRTGPGAAPGGAPRPSLWQRLRFALWLLWRRLSRPGAK
jgi:hypothetical protein